MQILTVLEGPSWADYHIAGSLEEMGHSVTRFTYGSHVGEFYPQARASQRLQKNRDLLNTAKAMQAEGGLDLIFCYVYDDFLLPEYASALADLNVPMVNFNVDMINQWYRQSRTARYFTRMLCAQRMNMDQLARYDAKVMYFPMAARLPAAVTSDAAAWLPAAPVTFVGTPMPYRTRVLKRLHEAGVPLSIYGKYWRENRQSVPEYSREKTWSDLRHYTIARLRAEGVQGLLRTLRQRFSPQQETGSSSLSLPAGLIHGFVPEGAMTAVFANSRINLGFSRMVGEDPDVKGINQVKLRDFEVPMAGGFYLVEKAPDYEELFKPGVEVETWETPAELIDKIHYYLQHENLRQQIADAGATRARAEHTWQQRFACLFAELGLDN